MRRKYSTDLSDEEWARLKARFPSSKSPGRPRAHSLRDIFDAIFYVLRSGCPWRLLPRDFPPWSTVYYHFRRFRLNGLWHLILRALRAADRKRVGRNPEPSAAILDSQSVKTTEESAHPSGYDPHKKVGGRKRHLLVDTMGLPLSICVTPANNVRDQHGARLLLIGRKLLMPRLKKIWADGAYDLAWLKSWCKKEGSWELEIVERDLQSKGFKVLPRRWVVERTFGWLSRNRRLAKDYERRVQTSEILIEVATIRLLLRRLARAA